MPPKVSNNQAAWEILFRRHDILNQVARNGRFFITSKEINTVREARLMAKFDQSSQLPEIFIKNGLRILPVSRYKYIIGPYRAYMPLCYTQTKPQYIPAPPLASIDLNSEAAALLYAFNSGIFQDLLESSQVFYTVSGRTTTQPFSFKIQDESNRSLYHTIQTDKPQIEIDGGFETADALYLCESKNVAVDEMLVRQLYYPYRLWSHRIDKPVMPVFLIYSNDVFHGFVYRFAEQHNYNSLEFIRHKAYCFSQVDIHLEDLEQLLGAPPKAEPNITFPQADSFVRVVDLLTMLFAEPLSKSEITFRFAFDERQTDYYLSAGQYLGLITDHKGGYTFTLTQECKRILNQPFRNKYLSLAAAILACPVFHDTFALTLQRDCIPNRREICCIMERRGLRFKHSTMERRASTVRSWITWILSLATTGQMTLNNM